MDQKTLHQEKLTKEEYELMKDCIKNQFFPKNTTYQILNCLFRQYFTEGFSLTEEEQGELTCSFIESLIDHFTNLPYGKCICN